MKISLGKYFVSDGKAYIVKVKNHSELNLPFPNRQSARNYKKSLHNSLKTLHVEINLVEFSGGYQIEEKVIS